MDIENDDYKNVTPLEWAEYELATVFTDNSLDAHVQNAVLIIIRRLYERASAAN